MIRSLPHVKQAARMDMEKEWSMSNKGLRRISVVVMVIATSLMMSTTDAFLPPTSSSRINDFKIWMARRNDNHNNKRLDKKRRTTTPSTFGGRPKTNKKGNPGRSKKTRKRDRAAKEQAGRQNLHELELKRAEQRTQAILPSQNKRAPPWHVLSPKDAHKNVEVEKQRRELAREGVQVDVRELSGPLSEKSFSKALMTDADRNLIKWKRFNPGTVPCGMAFIGSYLDRRLPPPLGVPEICFLGRSNVGKSSLLNRLASSALTSQASDEARVGKTPGATATVNLYAMLGKRGTSAVKPSPILGLADLPGFGYAKLSKSTKSSVQKAAERYLGKRQELALGILLVDARRVPNDDDRAVLAALYDQGVPIVVVATKTDKLGSNDLSKSMKAISEGLGLPEGQPLQVSSTTGQGIRTLWAIILEACETRIEELREKIEFVHDEIKTRANDKDGEQEDGSFIELDDEGNPMIPFDDGAELSYSQGYDWVHGAFYEPDEGDRQARSSDNRSSGGAGNVKPTQKVLDPDQMKLRDWQKIADEMIKRGEV